MVASLPEGKLQQSQKTLFSVHGLQCKPLFPMENLLASQTLVLCMTQEIFRFPCTETIGFRCLQCKSLSYARLAMQAVELERNFSIGLMILNRKIESHV